MFLPPPQAEKQWDFKAEVELGGSEARNQQGEGAIKQYKFSHRKGRDRFEMFVEKQEETTTTTTSLLKASLEI